MEKSFCQNDLKVNAPHVIPIFFAAGTTYYQHLCVTIVSILENNRHLSFVFHILTDKIDQTAIDKIATLKNKYKNFEIRVTKMEDTLFDRFVLSNNHISRQTYYRYMIPVLFPEYEKVLYLDCDLVVKGNLKELWDIDISDSYAAGARDTCIDPSDHKTWLGLAKNETYINAGVLLLNTKKMREDGMVEKLFENTKIHVRVIRHQDQDVINLTLKKKVKVIDQKFNFLSIQKRKKLDDPSILDRSIIVHYVGERKPWNYVQGCNLYLKRLYFKYLELTPYHDYRQVHQYRRCFYALRNLFFRVDRSEKSIKVYVLGLRFSKRKIPNSFRN